MKSELENQLLSMTNKERKRVLNKVNIRSNDLMKPFIKWVGGKTKVWSHISNWIPSDGFDTYYEPFVGGGAIFFALARAGCIKKAVISDNNKELITTYGVIKNDVSELISELKNEDYEYSKDNFLRIRGLETSSLSDIQIAARFIYLNKTCFNGLYRVNSSGKFNTPFGKYTNPKICDEHNLRAVSDALENTKIVCNDFEKILKSVKSDDFVYFDPPYIPISKTANFTSYTKDGFSNDEHRRLENVYADLTRKGVKAILSNSYCDLSLELYSKYTIKTIEGRRNVAGSTESRERVSEILVKNWLNMIDTSPIEL